MPFLRIVSVSKCGPYIRNIRMSMASLHRRMSVDCGTLEPDAEVAHTVRPNRFNTWHVRCAKCPSVDNWAEVSEAI